MIPSRRCGSAIAWASGLLLAASMVAPPPTEAVKFMTWNLLNYPSASGSAREPSFRTVIAATHPDVIVTQEMTGSDASGMNQFLNNVLNAVFPGEYAAGPWINGYDTDNALYYRIAAFDFISNQNIVTDLRDISEYVVRPDGYTADAAKLYLYSFHLKAGSTSDDQAQRLSECTTLRNHTASLPLTTHFMYAGDYNMHASTEAAYQKLLSGTPANGQAFDPINRPGTWYNSSSFADIHSQSPMPTNPYGGATGGMDDRFDISLVGAPLLDNEGLSYIPGTYKAYGNDGLHFNLAINVAPVIPEGQTMADALAGSSDHLPVIMEIRLPAKVGAVASLPFGTVIVGATACQNLAVSNSASTPADELNYSLAAPSGFTAPGGSFSVNAGAPANNHSICMSTGTAGIKSGNLTLSSNDVDTPAKLVALSGTVLDHAVPSTAASLPAVLLDTLDFGTHEVGEFVDLAAFVHNAGYGTLQALLNVYGAGITGQNGDRFSIVGGFSPAQVGGTPAQYTVHFDDTGLSGDSTCTASLVFSNRDQQDLNGATNLSNVTYHLVARVTSQTGVPETGSTPALTRLIGNAPNPFNPLTIISFDLSQAGPVQLSVFDVRGRLVSRLVDAPMDAGRHRVPWDGRDAAGRWVGSGVYFYRLETGILTQTRSMTLSK